jgi:pyridoxamine 5'-phosphate oxidase
MHWKSLRRQIRVRGVVEREEGPQADAYFASRSLKSRLGAWASRAVPPLDSRAALMAEVARVTAQQGTNPARPPFWGGFRIRPVEIEFWADGAFRLHDRFRWTRDGRAGGAFKRLVGDAPEPLIGSGTHSRRRVPSRPVRET